MKYYRKDNIEIFEGKPHEIIELLDFIDLAEEFNDIE